MFQPDVSDPESNTVYFDLYGVSNPTWVSVDDVLNKFRIAPPDTLGNGSHTITFTISDHINGDVGPLYFDVEVVNDPPYFFATVPF